MKTVLITGHTGFVGTNLTSYLNQKGFQTEGISLRNTVLTNISSSVSSIVHLAGKAHDLSNTSNAEDYFNVNTILTSKLFDQFLESNATTFIFISSVKAIADSLNGTLTEDEIPNPKTDYGKSKLEAERYILNKSLPKGKKIFILRPCMIHGPGNKGNLNLLYKIVKSGLPWPLGSFDNQRSFLSVENLCFVISELIKREDIPSGVYNLADDGYFSTNELVTLISNQFNRKPIILNIPKSFIKSVFGFGGFLGLSWNTRKLQKLTENYRVDNSKIKKVLKNTLPIKSKEGLKLTINSFINHKINK